jgi:hypothetical protein
MYPNATTISVPTIQGTQRFIAAWRIAAKAIRSSAGAPVPYAGPAGGSTSVTSPRAIALMSSSTHSSRGRRSATMRRLTQSSEIMISSEETFRINDCGPRAAAEAIDNPGGGCAVSSSTTVTVPAALRTKRHSTMRARRRLVSARQLRAIAPPTGDPSPRSSRPCPSHHSATQTPTPSRRRR